MCQTLCQVASYTLSDLVFVTTFMTKTALVSFILKGRKLKVSLVARMPASSPMYCCWPPWKFIYHLWAVEGIGEEAVAQSPQEHLGLWRRIALLGCLRPFAFFWNGSLCSGRGGRERGALSWRPGSWVSSSQVHQNGIWARLTHPPPGVCPDWLTIPDNLGTSWAVSMKSNGALISDKCSMMDGLWLTHFPHWGSEVTWEGRLEVPAPGSGETRWLASAQHFFVAGEAASVASPDITIHQGACGAPLGSFLHIQARELILGSVTGTEFGYHHLSCKFSCLRKRKCSHVILVHTDLKGEAGLKSIGIWNESCCGEKLVIYSTKGQLGSAGYNLCFFLLLEFIPNFQLLGSFLLTGELSEFWKLNSLLCGAQSNLYLELHLDVTVSMKPSWIPSSGLVPNCELPQQPVLPLRRLYHDCPFHFCFLT